VAILSEVGHFVMQFVQPLSDRLLHRAAEVGQHGVPQIRLVQRCDGVLSAGNSCDGAGAMRAMAVIVHGLSVYRQGERALLVVLPQLL
jgi:hypothetical protein